MLNRSYLYPHKIHPHYLSDQRVLSLRKSIKGEDRGYLNIIRNLSDPTKMKIYMILERVDEIPVSDITFILGISQSSVSHALSDLKNIGLVDSKRCGQLICYSLNKSVKINKILQFFNKFI